MLSLNKRLFHEQSQNRASSSNSYETGFSVLLRYVATLLSPWFDHSYGTLSFARSQLTTIFTISPFTNGWMILEVQAPTHSPVRVRTPSKVTSIGLQEGFLCPLIKMKFESCCQTVNNFFLCLRVIPSE